MGDAVPKKLEKGRNELSRNLKSDALNLNTDDSKRTWRTVVTVGLGHNCYRAQLTLQIHSEIIAFYTLPSMAMWRRSRLN